MFREVIRPLEVWDAGACLNATLHTGVILSACRIHRFGSTADTEAYIVAFHSSGSLYGCPLYLFQPRIQVMDLVRAEASPARQAVAV